MITYETAKQLKDAGFPQEGDNLVGNGEADMALYDACYSPTLSEIIDWCGPEFVELVRWENDLWTAANCERDTPMVHRGMRIEGRGPNPETAAANFGRAIREKQHD